MKTKNIVLCGLFAAILCCFAAITIYLPFTSIPITLQVIGVSVAGAVLGKKYGGLSVLIYVLIGLCGLPVFSGMKGGVTALAGPTGGYILGFIAEAFVTGYCIEKFVKNTDNKFIKNIKIFISMIIGLIVLYAIGTIQFMFISSISLYKALSLAVIPFVPLDVIKLVVSVLISVFIRNNIYNIDTLKASV